jgi:hypothetical protein
VFGARAQQASKESTEPEFHKTTPTNITAQLGSQVFLPCKVINLGDRSVSTSFALFACPQKEAIYAINPRNTVCSDILPVGVKGILPRILSRILANFLEPG